MRGREGEMGEEMKEKMVKRREGKKQWGSWRETRREGGFVDGGKEESRQGR